MVSKTPRLSPEKTSRYFTPCDAARVAKNVVQDQRLTEEEVLACIAKGLGFTHISLRKPPEVVEAGVRLSKDTVKAGFSLAKTVLEFAKRRLPIIAGRIAAILEFLDRVERFIDRLVENPEQEKVEDVIKKGTCTCKGDKKDQTIEVI